MANPRWFWRLVCEPDCSEACQVNCLGCRALADEWESQGRVTPAATDVMVAAARVAPDGKVFGLDASDEMLALSRANAPKIGAVNVEFLKGDMEAIPLPDDCVDVIISNCVVNLAPDKGKALSEAFRVLRRGGRLTISDIVTKHPVPALLKESLTAWAARIGGALSETEYRDRLSAAGLQASRSAAIARTPPRTRPPRACPTSLSKQGWTRHCVWVCQHQCARTQGGHRRARGGRCPHTDGRRAAAAWVRMRLLAPSANQESVRIS